MTEIDSNLTTAIKQNLGALWPLPDGRRRVLYLAGWHDARIQAEQRQKMS